MKRAILFPGQGSQSIGMLSDIANRAFSIVERFSEASEIVGLDLWKLVQDGPKEKLNKTKIRSLFCSRLAWACGNSFGRK